MADLTMDEKTAGDALATMMFFAIIGNDPRPGTDGWDVLNGIDVVPDDVTEARLDGEKVYLLVDLETDQLYWYFVRTNLRLNYVSNVD